MNTEMNEGNQPLRTDEGASPASIPSQKFIPMLGMGLSPDPNHLGVLVQDIVTCEKSLRESATRMVNSAARAGRLLQEAKKLVEHGQWKAWVESNLPISLRTAQLYMQLHSHLSIAGPEEAQRIALLPLSHAIKALPSNGNGKDEDQEPRKSIQWREAEPVLKSIEHAAEFLVKNLIPQLSDGSADPRMIKESKNVLRKALKSIEYFEARNP